MINESPRIACLHFSSAYRSFPLVSLCVFNHSRLRLDLCFYPSVRRVSFLCEDTSISADTVVLPENKRVMAVEALPRRAIMHADAFDNSLQASTTDVVILIRTNSNKYLEISHCLSIVYPGPQRIDLTL